MRPIGFHQLTMVGRCSNWNWGWHLHNMKMSWIIVANKRNSDKSVGLWFDSATNTFKCQTNSDEPPTLAAVTCRRPNECEIMKRLLQEVLLSFYLFWWCRFTLYAKRYKSVFINYLKKGDMSQATYSQCGEGCAELDVKVRETSHNAPNWFSIFLRCRGEDNMDILSQYFYDKDKMICKLRFFRTSSYNWEQTNIIFFHFH